MNPGLVVLEVRAAVPGSARATSLTDKSHHEPHKDGGDSQHPWTGALDVTVALSPPMGAQGLCRAPGVFYENGGLCAFVAAVSGCTSVKCPQEGLE